MNMNALVPIFSRFTFTALTLLVLSACQQPPQIVVNANSSANKTFTSNKTTRSRSAQIEAPPPTVLVSPKPPAPAQAPVDITIAPPAQPTVINSSQTPPKQQVCRVNDPNDTYVNLRQTPNGTLIGPVNNGTAVQISGYQADMQGRDWAAVMTSDQRVGFMFRRMITCG